MSCACCIAAACCASCACCCAANSACCCAEYCDILPEATTRVGALRASDGKEGGLIHGLFVFTGCAMATRWGRRGKRPPEGGGGGRLKNSLFVGRFGRFFKTVVLGLGPSRSVDAMLLSSGVLVGASLRMAAVGGRFWVGVGLSSRNESVERVCSNGRVRG